MVHFNEASTEKMSWVIDQAIERLSQDRALGDESVEWRKSQTE